LLIASHRRGISRLLSGGVKPVKDKRFDRPVAQNVFPVNLLQLRLVHVMIPDTLRINHHDRATAANAQAIGHAALDPLRVAQLVQAILPIQLAEAPVQPLAGFRLGAVAVNANKNMTAVSP
jgi:hypothetical protein